MSLHRKPGSVTEGGIKVRKKIRLFAQFRCITFFIDLFKLYFYHNGSRAAAELSYFLTLTFFPILICISALISQLQLDPTYILSETQLLFPESVSIILREYFTYINNNQSVALFVAGLSMAILFASSAVRGLMNIMREVYGRPTLRGLAQRAASILFSVLLLVVIYLAIVIMVTGKRFFHALGTLLKMESLVEQFIVWQWLKYVVLIAVVLFFIVILYRFSAPLHKPRPPVFPGALSAAVIITVASFIFSIFMENSTRYSLVYGSLTSVIILLIWLYLCSNILVIGGLINYIVYRNKMIQYVQ